MTYYVIFLNAFTLVLMDWVFQVAAEKKLSFSRVFIGVWCFTNIYGNTFLFLSERKEKACCKSAITDKT